MRPVKKHEALVHTLRHGSDRNCEHLPTPQTVKVMTEQMYLNHGKIICNECAEQKVSAKK